MNQRRAIAGLGARMVRSTARSAAGSIVTPIRRDLHRAAAHLHHEPPDTGDSHLVIGGLAGPPITVVADDGVRLHVEVDEIAPFLLAQDQPALEIGEAASDDRARMAPPLAPEAVGSQPGAAPPEAAHELTIVFSHGYLECTDYWVYERRALRGKARLVFWDLRGHGSSELGPSGTITIERMARDLGEVISAVGGPGPIILVGHSLGGMATMALAEHRPEWFGQRVAGVYLTSTSAKLSDYDIGLAGLGSLLWRVGPGALQRMMAHQRTGALVRGARRYIKPGEVEAIRTIAFGREAPEDLMAYTTQMVGRTHLHHLGDFLAMFGRHDVTSALPAVGRAEVAVITGDKDPVLPVKHSAELAKKIPGATFVVVRDGGHLISLDQPEPVIRGLRELLERVRRRLATPQS